MIFGFHTELPLVVNRPRPGPPTYDPDLPAADRRAAAEQPRLGAWTSCEFTLNSHLQYDIRHVDL